MVMDPNSNLIYTYDFKGKVIQWENDKPKRNIDFNASPFIKAIPVGTLNLLITLQNNN